jgi:hypothetical protein
VDIFYEKLDFSLIKSNNTTQDYGLCEGYNILILIEDLLKLLILNVCGNIIYWIYVKKMYKDKTLFCSYSMADIVIHYYLFNIA